MLALVVACVCLRGSVAGDSAILSGIGTVIRKVGELTQALQFQDELLMQANENVLVMMSNQSESHVWAVERSANVSAEIQAMKNDLSILLDAVTSLTTSVNQLSTLFQTAISSSLWSRGQAQEVEEASLLRPNDEYDRTSSSVVPTAITPPPSRDYGYQPPSSTCRPKIGELQARLVGPSDSELEGRLEVFHEGQWGTVCDDNFDNGHEMAKLFCYSMGLPWENAVSIYEIGGGRGPIWLDGIDCGCETVASKCTHNGWGANDCQHQEDIGLHCQ